MPLDTLMLYMQCSKVLTTYQLAKLHIQCCFDQVVSCIYGTELVLPVLTKFGFEAALQQREAEACMDTACSQDLLAGHVMLTPMHECLHQILLAVRLKQGICACCVGTLVEPRSSASTHSLDSADHWQETSECK